MASSNTPKTFPPTIGNEDARFISFVAEVVSALISAHDSGRDVHLNSLMAEMGKKHKIARIPRLTDIISAIPITHRKALVPYLKARPVRSASGISVVAVMCKPHRCPHIAMTGNICVYCLPEDGHQLLTNRGFLTLHTIEAIRAAGSSEPLLFATYNRATQCLEYQAASALVVNPYGTHTMVEMTHTTEAFRWDSASDEYGQSVGAPAGMPDSAVSLLVTADHRMLVTHGRVTVVASGDSQFVWDGGPSVGDFQQSVGNTDSYRIVRADSLLTCDATDAIKIRACAPGGMATSAADNNALPFTQLFLHSVAQRDAFLEMYGFWVGVGSLRRGHDFATQTSVDDSGRADAVLFAFAGTSDNVWLLAQLAAVGLREYHDFSIGDSSQGPQRSLCIYNAAWVELFFGEYAVQRRVLPGSTMRLAGAGLDVGELPSGSPSQMYDGDLISHIDTATPAGGCSLVKRFARWVWGLGHVHVGRMLAGLRRAKGGEASDGSFICTSSIRLRDEIVRLALHGGFSPSFTLDGNNGHPGRVAVGHATWKVALASAVTSQSAEPVLVPQRDVRSVPYTGRTWCVTVPNGLIVARRVQVRASDGLVSKASRPLIVGNCPGGPDSDFEYSTQSYTGYEPTSMRAIRARYNPYMQARHRVDQLVSMGHSVDKVEFIIMGGTFMALDAEYRDYFVRNLHDALSGHTSNSVEEAVRYSERSLSKCIGITIETRPDYCLKPHLSAMLAYGCTRLEIGVQSVYEDVARDTNRGHTVRAVSESFQGAKDAGFKVVAHMMPDLPNMGLERDIEGFTEFFENPAFRADGLKIYPTLVIRGTGLYELWKTGRYKSYPPSVLVDLVARILALVPPWTRVYRVQRDIPMPLVTSGVDHGNLRELALARMADFGTTCRDVRTREVGIVEIHTKVRPDEVELIRRDYTANGGWETFLAYEDPERDVLVGLLRLRRCSPQTFRAELKGRCSIVRELHVYGSVVPVSARDPSKFQHQGFGTLLMEEAERIARNEHRSTKLAVISGVGTRDYYRKLGFELEGPYMTKLL